MTIDVTSPPLAEPARRMATLLSNLPGMAYRCRPDSTWTMEFVSEGCRDLTGFSPAELTTGEGQAFVQLIAPIDRQAVDTAVRAAVLAGEAFTIEYRLIDRTGRIKHVWERGRMVGVGDDARLEGFITDITALKRTEVDLGERMKELRFLYEVTALCSGTEPLPAALSTIVEHAPAAYCYPPEVAARIVLGELVFSSPRFCCPPGAPRQSAPIVADGHVVGEIEVCRVNGDGPADAYFLREEQDMLAAVADRIGAFVERERILDALRASERKARALYECLPTPTVVWRRRGDDFELIDHNAAARALTGGFVAACIGRPLRELLPAHPDIAADIERCFTERAPSRRELEHRLADGRTLTLAISLGFVPPDLVLAHVADVTLERRLEHRFHEAQKMEVLGRLAAGVAHDFNNMLTVILAYSDLLLRGAAPDGPQRADLLEIRKAGERAAALTHQLTTFSRQQVVHREVVDLNRQIADVARMLEQILGADRQLLLALTDEPCPVELHPPHLDQALFNLVVNARDATDPGGRVTIETHNIDIDADCARTLVDVSPGTYVMLAVSDTGVGMDAATRARVFEPFFTTKPPGMGTGMGLATVYGTVRQCGGYAAVYSEPGRGSTFRLYFPRATATASARPSPSPQQHRARAGETILVVEDEEPIRRLVQRVLEAAGYRVLTAASGAEARALRERHGEAIDLLLTDIVLPWESGPELAGALPGTRVLFMSGYAERAARAAAELRPGANFIAKPFNAEMLTRLVREILDRPAPA
jgi:PAS domain S-box-containing protein